MPKQDLPLLSKSKLTENAVEGTLRSKTLISSKSDPSISRKRAQTTAHSKPSRVKQLFSSDKRFPDYKRNIVPNTEKSTACQRKPYFIYEQGSNFTPLALYDPNFPSQSEKLFGGLPYKIAQLNRFGTKGAETRSNSSMQSLISASASVSRFSIVRRSSLAPSVFSVGMASLGALTIASVAQSEFEEELDVLSEDRAPSMFRLREDPSPREKEIETTFKVTLQESETMVMLDIPSEAEFLESEEGKAIAVANFDYERTKQTSKSLSHTATQTTQVIKKHRKLHMPKGKRANSSAWATVWDIYDTYKNDTRTSIVSEFSREEGQVELHKEVIAEEESYEEQFEWNDQIFDHSFLDALMIMERLIQREHYGQKQLLYQGLLVEDPMSLNVQYNYHLEHLWTFKNKYTASRVVTSISNNCSNPNIIAVGYGKFKYTDKCKGLVCVWNVKSPDFPERHYQFEDPVTFVTFSSLRPQILAVTFYSGLVVMLDIISRTTLIKASNDHYPIYYPVWQCLWFPHEENSPYQNLLTCNTNGRIFRYKKSKFFFSRKIMSMSRPHGNIQGVTQPKQCHARSILSKRNPSAEIIVAHPVDPLIYLVGTAEGCVYICSVNHRKDHVDVFVAHNGPIYNIQFNPFCNKIFLTCGADWCIRIWAEGIFEPLVTLESGMASVQGALWNPIHSTIILSITGTCIEVWDIRRKISAPKTSMKSPSESFNTAVQFSLNNFNVYIGDEDGNVHVMALTKMPFSPAFQETAVAQAVMNMLVTRPDLLDKLEKLGPPFVPEEHSRTSKMMAKLRKLEKRLV